MGVPHHLALFLLVRYTEVIGTEVPPRPVREYRALSTEAWQMQPKKLFECVHGNNTNQQPIPSTPLGPPGSLTGNSDYCGIWNRHSGIGRNVHRHRDSHHGCFLWLG